MEADQRALGERGETLVEVLAALVILSIAGVAIATGLMVSVRASDAGRNSATGSAYARSFAEAIQKYVDTNAGFAPCGSAATTYAGVAVPDLGSGDTVGYSKAVTSVQSWTGTAWGSCVNGQVQRITVSVTSSGNATHDVTESLVVVLRPPCNGPAVAAGANPCTG